MLLPQTFLYHLLTLCLIFQSAVATWPVRNGTEFAKSNNYIVQVNPNVDLLDFGPKLVDGALHFLRSIIKDTKLDDIFANEGHHLQARCFSEREKKQVELKESFNINEGFKALAVKIMDNRVVEKLATSFAEVVSIFPDDEIDFELPIPGETKPRLGKRYYGRRHRQYHRRWASEHYAHMNKRTDEEPTLSTATTESSSTVFDTTTTSLTSRSSHEASPTTTRASHTSASTTSDLFSGSTSVTAPSATLATPTTSSETTSSETTSSEATSTQTAPFIPGPTDLPEPRTFIKEKKNVPWNLVRISQRERDLEAPYIYDSRGGDGVTVYVVDDGINIAHKDFEGRAKHGWSIYDRNGFEKRGSSAGSENPLDGGGHGTHVAGIIGGNHFGVAKNVSLVSVQVLSANGKGSVSNLLGGLQYILEKEKGKNRKVVVNMSLGLSKESPGTKALDEAITAVINAGIPVVAAAGNSASNACNYIPAGNPGVFTVAAIDSEDALDSYSCYGKCVNILAPGFDIESDYIGSEEATANLSGTSMASPHVAGVAALLLNDIDSPTPQQLYDAITDISTKNLATGLPRRTPNLIVFNGQNAEELEE